MGIRPMMYINGNYANSVVAPIVSFFPNLWSARWPTAGMPAPATAASASVGIPSKVLRFIGTPIRR